MFLMARASHVPCQLADRAFGAQRFSGGRAGRRFAPPSADLRLEGWAPQFDVYLPGLWGYLPEFGVYLPGLWGYLTP